MINQGSPLYQLLNFHFQITLFLICPTRGYENKEDGVIYILMWTSRHFTPFHHLQLGRQSFIQRDCPFQNCHLSDKTTYLKDILEFDVLLFNVLNLHDDIELPSKRSPEQSYVLVSIEPAGIHKVPWKLDRYFNLTWTYKLDSDAVFPYIVVKNDRDEIIGPKIDMHWLDTKAMNATKPYVKSKLYKKRIAAAWFVSNCEMMQRNLFGEELQEELAKYNQRVDVFGDCGEKKCPNEEIGSLEECYALVESTYYFYLAFENSFGDDYVTEKLLTGLEHFAVPVVHGSANYTRFVPDGIYLNAVQLGAKKLAKEMNMIIHNKTRYYDFFKWHGYYSFHYTGENDFYYEICGFCALLNNKTRMSKKTVYRTNLWWNEWYNGIPAPNGGFMRLLINVNDEKPDTTGITGFFANLYAYVFDT